MKNKDLGRRRAVENSRQMEHQAKTYNLRNLKAEWGLKINQPTFPPTRVSLCSMPYRCLHARRQEELTALRTNPSPGWTVLFVKKCLRIWTLTYRCTCIYTHQRKSKPRAHTDTCTCWEYRSPNRGPAKQNSSIYFMVVVLVS